ncbi:MAG TPA: SAF domain-containing protein [Mycobacteriales bacterium]|jgi:Flp pilus assembly protein CpaB|nr:SAF domain-containing protein [Mycobacteriales bacterium]
MIREASPGTELTLLRTRASDLVQRHRRTAGAALAAVAVILGATAMRPHPAPTTRVWVAAHDLGGGAPLTASDVRSEQLPSGDVPDGALPADHEPIGLVLGAPVRRGEPLTDLRILTINLVAASGAADDLAVPIRVTDGPAALALVKPGERIAVIAAVDPSVGVAGRARTVVQDVRVLAVPAQLADEDSGLIIVAATPKEAKLLAQISSDDRVSVAVRH